MHLFQPTTGRIVERPKGQVGERVKAPAGHPRAGRIGRIVRVYESKGRIMVTVVWPEKEPTTAEVQ